MTACIVQAAVTAAFLNLESYRRERASVERDMVATARALMPPFNRLGAEHKSGFSVLYAEDNPGHASPLPATVRRFASA